VSSNQSCSCRRTKWTLVEVSLVSLGNERLYWHPSHARDPSGLFLFTWSAALPVHLQHWPFHCYLLDLCSKPFYLHVLFWIPTKVREYTDYPLEEKSVAQIKCRVCIYTFLFSLYLTRGCRALFPCWEVWAATSLHGCHFPFPYPCSSFLQPIPPWQGQPALHCGRCCGATHTDSLFLRNPRRTGKAASLLEGVTSAQLHTTTRPQALLACRKQAKGTFFPAPG